MVRFRGLGFRGEDFDFGLTAYYTKGLGPISRLGSLEEHRSPKTTTGMGKEKSSGALGN